MTNRKSILEEDDKNNNIYLAEKGKWDALIDKIYDEEKDFLEDRKQAEDRTVWAVENQHLTSYVPGYGYSSSEGKIGGEKEGSFPLMSKPADFQPTNYTPIQAQAVMSEEAKPLPPTFMGLSGKKMTWEQLKTANPITSDVDLKKMYSVPKKANGGWLDTFDDGGDVDAFNKKEAERFQTDKVKYGQHNQFYNKLLSANNKEYQESKDWAVEQAIEYLPQQLEMAKQYKDEIDAGKVLSDRDMEDYQEYLDNIKGKQTIINSKGELGKDGKKAWSVRCIF